MSKKDLAGKAALKALKRPEKGSAEAEAHRQAALEAANAKPESEKKLPQKGSSEAYAHNLAAKEALKSSSSSPQQGKSSGSGFLLLAVLIPVAAVVGLYFYSKLEQNSQGSLTASSAISSNSSSSQRAAKTRSNSLGLTNPLRSRKTLPTEKTAAPETSTGTRELTNSNQPVTLPLNADAKAHTTTTLAKNAHGAGPSHWDYSSTDWALLDPAYKTCGAGKKQSPINIQTTTPLPTGPSFSYNYLPSAGKISNNGHTIMVNLAKGNQLLVNGNAYELLQFHFHTPSENRINNRSYPMELHMVHKNQQGQLAVVAVMIEAGPPNPLLDRLPLPSAKGQSTNSQGASLNPVLVLPYDRNTFTFSGSLTTPPCTQNVGWIVMKTPITVTPQTLARFQKVMGKNNRPVQPANRRTIFSSY